MKKRLAVIGAVLCIVLLAACGVAGCAGAHRLETPDGLTRKYNLYVPGTPPKDSAGYPLVIAMHQFSDTARGMEKLTGFNALADEKGFIVAYPQGRFRVWRTAPGETPDDAVFLEAMLDAIVAEHPVDPSRIYATGASAGGMMAQWLACKSGRIAAIAPVMGSQPDKAMAECVPGRIVPALVIHGNVDPVVPFEGGETFAGPGRERPVFLSAAETAAFWAGNNGCTGEALEEELPPTNENDPTRIIRRTYPCAAGGDVVFYEIDGGGHTWPGAKNWYPGFIVGATSSQLDASRVIWDFFKDKRLHEP